MGRGANSRMTGPGLVQRHKPVSQSFAEVQDLFERLKAVHPERAEKLLDEKVGGNSPLELMHFGKTWREALEAIAKADEQTRSRLDSNPGSLPSFLLSGLAEGMRRDLEILLGDRRQRGPVAPVAEIQLNA